MQSFLQNVWVKRVISLINITYVAVIAILTYATFIYQLEFKEGAEIPFLVVYLIASAVFLLLMAMTRDQIITRIIGVVLPLVVFFFILFNIGDWILIIPSFIVAVTIFLMAKNNETLKVIMGTIYLLIYVLGLIIFFVINTLFGGTSTVETRLDSNLANNSSVYEMYKDQLNSIDRVLFQTDSNGNFIKDENGNLVDNTISPDGTKQFYLADIQDNNKGKLSLFVVPYGEDKDFKFFTLKQKGIRKTVYNFTRGEVPLVAWKDDFTIEYQAKDSKKVETTTFVMPDKNYLEFLGIS